MSGSQDSHDRPLGRLAEVMAQYLLSAIGAAPHLSRPNFPQHASHYPAGVHLALLPFGEQALRHFMFLERPVGMALHDAEGLAAVNRAAPLVQAGDIVPPGQDFATVGRHCAVADRAHPRAKRRDRCCSARRAGVAAG